MKKQHNRRRPYYSKKLAKLSTDLLETADRLWRAGDTLDTDVRDTLADGLARLVYVAYDCDAVSNQKSEEDEEGFQTHREWATEKWFRDRGFADWYAKGAATLFHTVRLPSVIRLIQYRTRKPWRKKLTARRFPRKKTGTKIFV